MKILDGNSLKASILKTLSEETTNLKTKHNQVPGLAVILIGATTLPLPLMLV